MSIGSLGVIDNKAHTGTIGDIGCFSFNANHYTGGGGMLVTQNTKFARRANIYQPQKNNIYFQHDDRLQLGLPNILATIGLYQLKRF